MLNGPEVRKSEPEKDEVEIRVGTLFSVKGYRDTDKNRRIDIVTEIGREDFFYSSRVHTTPEGDRYFGHSGTVGPENIEEIIGCVSPEEVVAMEERGWHRRCGRPLPDELREDLIRCINEGARMLKMK